MLKLTILLALVTLSLTQEDGESIQNKEDDNLITLNLSNQGITSLNEYDFTKYPLLEELDLSNNDIEYIKEDILIDNVHLKKLNLSGNKNLKFPEFSTLLISEIEELSLANCNIEQLPANIFDGLVNLKIIDLSENPLDEKGIEVSTLLAILSPKKVILPSIHESMIKEICEQLDITIGIKSQDYSDAIECADVREGKWQNLPKEEASQEINLEEQEEENLPQAENEDDNIIVEIKRQASPEESVHNDDPAQAEGSEGEGLAVEDDQVEPKGEENIEAGPEENKPEGEEEDKIEPAPTASEGEEENKEPEGVEENKIEPDPSAQEVEEENKEPEGPEETKIEPDPSAQEGQEENKEPDQAAPEGAEEQVEADPSPQEEQEGNPVAPEGAEENKIEPDPSPEENKPDEGVPEDKTEPEITAPEGEAQNQENLEPSAPEAELENKDNLEAPENKDNPEVPENKDNPEPPQLEGEGDPQDKLEPPTAEGGADTQDKVEEKTPEVAAPDTIDRGGNPPDAVDGKRMLPANENQEGDEPKQKGIGGAENNTAPRSAINTNAANPSDETKAGESSSKSSGAGSTVLVVLVCVVVVAGAAAFGYKFYKTRKYQAAQSVEPVERELKEIVVDKRLNGSSNPQNQIEAQPLMDRLANSVEIKEIDEINDKSDTTASGSNNNGPYVPTTTPIKPPHVNKDDGKAEI